MTSEFPILLVTQKAYEASSNETLGSKYKFWFYHEELGRCLYKQSRENLGEDWAEKVVSELCELLTLPMLFMNWLQLGKAMASLRDAPRTPAAGIAV